MKKSSKTEYTKRINFIIEKLATGVTRTEVKKALMTNFNISERQAFRYLKVAQSLSEPLVIPEMKLVFTVKLPASLIHHVKSKSAESHLSISALVAEALESFLITGGKSGKSKR